VVKTDATVGEIDALVWFAATVTVAGTLTAALLLVKLTVTLLVEAAARFTAHVMVPAPLIWDVQWKELRLGAGAEVPSAKHAFPPAPANRKQETPAARRTALRPMRRVPS
jgi:hypothetical protein